MDLEHFIIQMEKLHIKASGKSIIFMVKVKYLMTKLLILKEIIIMKIVQISIIFGWNTMDNCSKIVKKEKDFLSLLMDNILKEYLRMINCMVYVNFINQMDR
jgi:hypothetical protein